jgi:type II secretory pathway component PulC
LAFIEDSDVQKPQPQVIMQQAPRGPLVPVLLVVLILAVAGLAVVMALPYLKTDTPVPADTQPVSISQLDPAMLMTPSGRKLDVVEFGGFVFEITRLAYFTNPRARTVTITVPGNPPQMGVFHVGESFAGGKIRVVEITGSSVVLESAAGQQVFAINGSDPSEIWDRAPEGTQIIPPLTSDAIPDLPPGKTSPPKDPRVEIEAESEPEQPTDKPALESIEDLPDLRETAMPRTEYEALRRMLPDDFANDFVLAKAIERETRVIYGLEIKNIAGDSFYYAHGLERGDIITHINGEPVTSVQTLDAVLKSNLFREEIAIDIERDGAQITFVFYPGVTD